MSRRLSRSADHRATGQTSGICHVMYGVLTQLRGLATYPIPRVDVQVSGAMQSKPGTVPREHSLGERQRRDRVVRSAHPVVQSLLVQAAWRISRSGTVL
jgi:Transposase IS116/IS110/IS902 family